MRIKTDALRNLRAEFAVAYAGANFHFWPDCCDCSDDFSALVRRDTVAAAQGRVWAQDAQNSFDALKTVFCVFEEVVRAGDQPPMQIGKTVSTQHEFARGTPRL